MTFVLAAASVTTAMADGLRTAPEFVINMTDGSQKLLSSYKGKPICLAFFFTTCPHCQAQSKVMTKFQNEFAGKGFQALDLAINLLDNGGTAESANSAATMFSQKIDQSSESSAPVYLSVNSENETRQKR